jgi:NitT/TauT family transport system substrate-binding protein
MAARRSQAKGKRMKILLRGIAASILVASTAGVHAQERVVASWLPIMQTMAYYVALEEKLFEKAGIQVDSVKFQSPNQIIESLVSGRADFGPPGAAAGITVLAEAEFSGTFKVFGLQGGGIKVDRINDGLIVANNSTIKSFADLKGKTLGHLPGVQWRTISRHMVRSAGLDPEKDVVLKELAVGLQVPAVVSGSVDATLSLEPVGSIAVASKEAKRAMTNPVAMVIADPFYSGVSLLTVKFLKERPQVARKVVEVIDEATKLANADFDKYKPIIPKYTPMRAEQLDLLAKPYLRGFGDLNDTDLNSYQALVDVFQKEGVLQSPIAVRDKILKTTDFGS